ncbi:MAG: hypothetical protein WBE97_10745, partial [Candidatus Acidiferrales bacterium]
MKPLNAGWVHLIILTTGALATGGTDLGQLRVSEAGSGFLKRALRALLQCCRERTAVFFELGESRVKQIRFIWKSTCTTCRDARSFLRKDLGAELDERDYAKVPLSAAELKELFAGRDPRDFLNARSPAFKA